MNTSPGAGVRHDMECRECEFFSEDVTFPNAANVIREGDCPSCGAENQFRIVYLKTYGIDNKAKGMGYGVPRPDMPGVTFDSYGDKRQYYRENGLEDACDPVGGSRDPMYPEGYNGPGNFTPPKRDRTSALDIQAGWDLGAALMAGKQNVVDEAAQMAVRKETSR